MKAPGAQIFQGLFEGEGKTVLSYRSWRPPFSDATFVILHGMGEHSGRYETLIEALEGRGISFYAYDQRGHGLSEGQRGHATSCQVLADDLGHFLRLVSIHEPDKPMILFAHSFGGLIALKYLIDLTRKSGFRPDGLILSNPLIEMALKIPAWKKKLAGALSRMFPKFSFRGEVRGRDLSHDPAYVIAYEKDPLVHSRCTAGFYFEILRTMDFVKQEAPRIDVPLLMLLATKDPVCDPQGGRFVFEKFQSSDKKLEVYEGFLHEPIHEIGKEKVFRDVLSWFDARWSEKKSRSLLA